MGTDEQWQRKQSLSLCDTYRYKTRLSLPLRGGGWKITWSRKTEDLREEEGGKIPCALLDQAVQKYADTPDAEDASDTALPQIQSSLSWVSGTANQQSS